MTPLAEPANWSRLTVLFPLWAVGMPATLIDMKPQLNGRLVETNFACGHIPDLTARETVNEAADGLVDHEFEVR